MVGTRNDSRVSSVMPFRYRPCVLRQTNREIYTFPSAHDFVAEAGRIQRRFEGAASSPPVPPLTCRGGGRASMRWRDIPIVMPRLAHEQGVVDDPQGSGWRSHERLQRAVCVCSAGPGAFRSSAVWSLQTSELKRGGAPAKDPLPPWPFNKRFPGKPGANP